MNDKNKAGRKRGKKDFDISKYSNDGLIDETSEPVVPENPKQETMENIDDATVIEETSEPVETASEPASEKIPSADYNPFEKETIKREYTAYDTNGTAAETRVPVDEYVVPDFDDIDSPGDTSPPSIGGGDATSGNSGIPSGGPGAESPGDSGVGSSANSGLNDLGDKDKEIAAEQLTDGILAGYNDLHGLGRNLAKVSDKKLRKLHTNGEIDLAMEIELDDGRLSVKDVFNEYNQEVDETITLDDEFIKTVRPVMIRIAKKRGYGLTDEQFLGVTVAKDLLQKGIMVGALIAQSKDLVNQFREMKADEKIMPPSSPQPEQEQQPKAEPDPEVESTAPDESGDTQNAPIAEPEEKQELVKTE